MKYNHFPIIKDGDKIIQSFELEKPLVVTDNGRITFTTNFPIILVRATGLKSKKRRLINKRLKHIFHYNLLQFITRIK